jgi:TPR repeat protein
MADNAELQHTPKASKSALAASPARSGIFSRGRQQAARSTASAEAQAHLKLGLQHYRAKDFTTAAAAFRQAAELGLSEAQYRLALLYDEGRGVPQSFEEAARWDRLAAEQNHPYAQAALSYRYNAGEGVQQDLAESFAWCKRAAENNLAWAQRNLGLMYRKGEGDADAQQELATLHFTGRSLPRDIEAAALWFTRAAEQGHAAAQFHLAHLYDTGQGVPQDYVQARQWLRKAALQGHEQAQRDLKKREYRDA